MKPNYLAEELPLNVSELSQKLTQLSKKNVDGTLKKSHDVIGVRFLGNRGPYAKIYVDGLLTCSAQYRNGGLELRGEVEPSARTQVIDVAEKVLGKR